MPVPSLMLLAFVAWTLLLVTALGVCRVAAVARGKAHVTSYAAPAVGGSGGGGAMQRLQRAHLNCTENLPMFGAVVLSAQLRGGGPAWFDLGAMVYMAARVGQSVAHVSGGTAPFVRVRFTCFAVQLCVLAGMVAALCRGL